MIIVRLQGGLGNQMFQYAFGRALSLRHGVPLKIDISSFEDKTKRPFRKNFVVRDYALSPFAIAGAIAEKKDIPFIHQMYGHGSLMLIVDALRRRILSWKGKEHSYTFDSSTEKFGPDTYLVGEWQSPKYFNNITDTIRKDFTLKNQSVSFVQKIQEISARNAVSVHVRRGDYVGNPFYESMGMSYYQSALKAIESRATIDTVFVFSDDILWCKENLSFDYPVVFIDKNELGITDQEELLLMSACKHFVIANSSFSWWGAWLSDNPNKIVIAPKKWFSDDKNTNDLIPKEWIRI